MTDAEELGLPPRAFEKQGGGDDLPFYTPPRLVSHIDDAAIAALTAFYRTVLPPAGRVLDLLSSWISHLPDEVPLDVVGHGMNADELNANSRLSRWFVQDLNAEPILPETDHVFEAVLACVGIQYLQRPLTVLREVRRVLVSGCPVVISFSNRCFPTKAVAIWRALDLQQQAGLVRLYLERSGFECIDVRILADGRAGDPLIAVTGLA